MWYDVTFCYHMVIIYNHIDVLQDVKQISSSKLNLFCVNEQCNVSPNVIVYKNNEQNVSFFFKLCQNQFNLVVCHDSFVDTHCLW